MSSHAEPAAPLSRASASCSLHELQFFRGRKHGLPQATATVRLNVAGSLAGWGRASARVAEAAHQAFRFVDGVAEIELPQALCPGADGPGIANWLGAITVGFQRMAHDAVGPAQVVACDDGGFELAFCYQRQDVLRGSLSLALRHLFFWAGAGAASEPRAAELARATATWLQGVQAQGLAPNTLRFALAALDRGIPLRHLDRGLIELGWGAHAVRMDSSFSGRTGNLATRIARDKAATIRLLLAAALPVPASTVVASLEQALAAAQKLGWPVVVKPSNQDQGRGVVPDIRTPALLQTAFDAAARFSPGAVIVESHIAGDDHRMLVVGGRLLATTRRVPGGVTGNGLDSVAQLVQQVNTDPRRGSSKRSLMMQLALDEEALLLLSEQGLTPGSLVAAGLFVRLRRTANISTGGTALDVSGLVHPDNRLVAERAARAVGLDIAGVDFLCPDISRSWREVGGAVCEVNAQPGFRPHWLGDPQRDINGEIVDWLFKDKPARIPVAAITGTNGKTTTAMMLHHLWTTAGQVCGVTTTAGTWVGRDLVSPNNLSGQPGAAILLGDPTVEAAVIEMPRKGLIVFGHPCDRYDVAALLNVQDDHIGMDGITSLAQMAALKAEVLARASQAVVVNAEDPLCMAALAKAGTSRHILVARNARAPTIGAHLARGGEAVFIESLEAVRWLVLAKGLTSRPLLPLADIPATLGGLLPFNETNALFAAALAWAQGLAPELIRQGLVSFHNSFEQNPGRYNFMKGLPFEVLLDYGHNPEGLAALCRLVDRHEVKGRRVIASVIGNRFAHHVAQQAEGLAKTFDGIYVAQDAVYFQGNSQGFGSEDPLGEMLREVARCLQPLLRPAQTLELTRSRQAAIEAALASCRPGDLLVLLAEPWEALPLLAPYRRAASADPDAA